MKGKLIFVTVLALATAGLVLSVVSYSAVDAAVNRTIQERLMTRNRTATTVWGFEGRHD